MVRLPWERDRHRTCESCGESWFVPYGLRRQSDAARKRPTVTGADRRRRLLARDTAARQAIEQAAARDESRRAAARRVNELAAGLALCPVCGSRSWSETKLTRHAKEG